MASGNWPSLYPRARDSSPGCSPEHRRGRHLRSDGDKAAVQTVHDLLLVYTIGDSLAEDPLVFEGRNWLDATLRRWERCDCGDWQHSDTSRTARHIGRPRVLTPSCRRCYIERGTGIVQITISIGAGLAS